MSASGFPFQVTRGIVARDVEGEGCGDAGGTVGGGVGGRRRGTRRPTNAVLQGGAGVAVAGATSCAPPGESDGGEIMSRNGGCNKLRPFRREGSWSANGCVPAVSAVATTSSRFLIYHPRKCILFGDF